MWIDPGGKSAKGVPRPPAIVAPPAKPDFLVSKTEFVGTVDTGHPVIITDQVCDEGLNKLITDWPSLPAHMNTSSSVRPMTRPASACVTGTRGCGSCVVVVPISQAFGEALKMHFKSIKIGKACWVLLHSFLIDY